MKTLDYINVRDAQVHGLVNPTFIMYGNCSLKDYSFEVTVDGKKREGARRAHGSSAEHAMRDLIASHAPLRDGSHKARPVSCHY